LEKVHNIDAEIEIRKIASNKIAKEWGLSKKENKEIWERQTRKHDDETTMN
jgi:hypothetical protein